MLQKSVVAIVLCSLVLVASSAVGEERTVEELAGDWWNWGMQFPSDTNPVLDETGEFGHLGQEVWSIGGNPVWFLAGTFGADVERELTVPEGRALFFPLVNTAWWPTEPGETEAEMRAGAKASIDGTGLLQLTVDGLGALGSSVRAASPPGGFVISIPEGSVLTDFGYDPGDFSPTVADGYWVLLEPLGLGDHEIHFRGAMGDPAAPDFSLDVAYLVHVVPEPSTIVLAASGLLGAVAYGWRRRRRVRA